MIEIAQWMRGESRGDELWIVGFGGSTNGGWDKITVAKRRGLEMAVSQLMLFLREGYGRGQERMMVLPLA